MNLQKYRSLMPLLVILGILALIFSAAIFSIIYNNMTTSSTDLLPRWYGAKFFFEDGISPYDVRVGEASQREIFGRLTEEGEDQVLFAYPFYAVFYLNVLALLPYQFAAAVYMQLMFYGMLLGLALMLHLLRWLPSPPVLVVLILITAMGYPSVRGVLLAQLALLAYAFHIVSLWGIAKGYDGLAGAMLGLATIKPQTGYIIVPLLLLWAWRFERYRVIGGFVLVFGGLMGGSFLLEPAWFGDWIEQIRSYPDYTTTVPPTEIITHAWGLDATLEDILQWGSTALLAIPIVMAWYQILVQHNDQKLLWAYLLVMAFSVTTAPRTATTYYVELYPLLYIVIMLLAKQRRFLAIYGGSLVFLVGYWALHILTLPPADGGPGGTESAWVYLVFPIAAWGLLFIFRDSFPNGLLSAKVRSD